MKIPVVAAAAAFSVFAHAVPVTNSNGSVMTPNSDLARGQPVATDVSGLLSSESDPNVAVTNGELWVRGERVETGSVDPSGVRGIVDSSFAGGTQAVNRAVSDRRDRDDLRVYRRVRDVWTWRDWPNDWATTNAPADFLAAANSPGAYPLAYREATGSWMYANQYWPNGNLKYDASMPPGSAASGGDLVLNFRFVARAEDGVTELFRFGATATRESATDGTLVDWETDGPPHGAPVRVATTDLVGMELARKAGRDELVAATNGIRSVDGAARPLPKYLHALDFADSYTNEAAAYYRSRGDGKVDGGCSAVRDGNFLYRNFDFPFDGRAEFVVKMAAGAGRFASVGVAQVGTNLTERMVTSGRHSRCYKWLPGATVDGVNENGVVCEINVVDTDPPRLTGGDIHPLAAVRWALDNGTSAEMVATSLASRVMWPSGWAQNFHWMVADAAETWIVENGTASNVTAVAAKRVMTNFPILPDDYEGMGKERYDLLRSGANITNAWYTRAYRRETNPPWVSDLAEVIAYTNEIFTAWAAHPKEYFRNQLNGGQPWWQSIHTSIYDIRNRTMRLAVQETDDWYVFAVPSAGGVKPEAVREIVAPLLEDKLDKSSVDPTLATNGVPADAKATGDRLDSKLDIGDAGTLGRFLGTYEYLGTERCRTDMAVGDVVFVKVQGTDVGQYARIVNAKVAGDVLEIADTKAIPSADFPTPGFAALLGMADPTLTVKGRPADAKATGDALKNVLTASRNVPRAFPSVVLSAPGVIPNFDSNFSVGFTNKYVSIGLGSYAGGPAFLDIRNKVLGSGITIDSYGRIYGHLSVGGNPYMYAITNAADSGTIMTETSGYRREVIDGMLDEVDGKIDGKVSKGSSGYLSPSFPGPAVGWGVAEYGGAGIVFGNGFNANGTTYLYNEIYRGYGNKSILFPDRAGTFALEDSESLYSMFGDADSSSLASNSVFKSSVESVVGNGYVPYRGASDDVDLGAYEISAETVNATRVQAKTVEADDIECIGGTVTATKIALSLGLKVYGNFGPEIVQDGFYTTGQDVFYTAGKRSYDSWEEVTEAGWNSFRRVTGRNDDGEIEYEFLGDVLESKADIDDIPDPYVPSATDPTFSNAVLSVGLNIDTNSVAVLNEIAVTFGGFPIGGTATTVGGLLAALAAAVAWLRKRAAHLESDGTADDDFATDLLGKPVAIQKIDERLPIPISSKSAGFTTESYKRFVVTVSGAMTVTLHKPTGTDADVFECRFDGSGLSADSSITFAKVAAFGSADAITTMDTNCGTVTAGKVALMSAFWNGATWDVNWKVEG